MKSLNIKTLAILIFLSFGLLKFFNDFKQGENFSTKTPLNKITHLKMPLPRLLNLKQDVFSLTKSENKNKKNETSIQESFAAIETTTSAPFYTTPLVNNWNLNYTELPIDTISNFIQERQPSKILFFNNNKLDEILPEAMALPEQQSNQVLFVANEASINKVKEERENRSLFSADPIESKIKKPNESPQNPIETLVYQNSISKLAENSFEVVFFKPGKRDNGETLVPVNNSTISALQGPDYSLEDFDYKNDFLMRQNLSRVLSLGHGGELLLKVINNGIISDDPGFDFAVFENSLGTGKAALYFQEFAYIGVSEFQTPDSFKWFPCDPFKQILWGCVGAVPTAKGGDQFDLSSIGVKKAKYIWIKDIGKNHNKPSKWPTEGVDIDAVRLINAYPNQ